MSAARPQTDRERAEELGARYQQLKHEAKLGTEGLAPTLAQIAVLVPSLVATLTAIPEGETIPEGEAWARFVEEEMRELGISDEQMQRYIARLRPLSNTPVDGIMAVFRLFLDELRERGRSGSRAIARTTRTRCGPSSRSRRARAPSSCSSGASPRTTRGNESRPGRRGWVVARAFERDESC